MKICFLILQVLSLFALVFIAAALVSGAKLLRAAAPPTRYDYKVETYEPDKSVLPENMWDEDRNIFSPSEKELNDLGEDGWELCGTFTELETMYPKDVGTGAPMGSNVRTSRVVFVFKRKE